MKGLYRARAFRCRAVGGQGGHLTSNHQRRSKRVGTDGGAAHGQYLNTEFSLWDRFDIPRNLTLREFLAYMKDVYKLTVTMLSCGVSMLYNGFMAKKKVRRLTALHNTSVASGMCADTRARRCVGLPGRDGHGRVFRWRSAWTCACRRLWSR